MRSGKSVKQMSHPLKSDTRAPHDPKPAWRKSRSTSYTAGVFPSAPTARVRGRQRGRLRKRSVNPQACQVSCLALELSSDQALLTRATSNRALLRGPSSGYLPSPSQTDDCGVDASTATSSRLALSSTTHFRLHSCTSCAVMAKYIKVVATPAVARGWGKK